MSIRTVIVLSALSETTTPWRTFCTPATCSRGGVGLGARVRRPWPSPWRGPARRSSAFWRALGDALGVALLGRARPARLDLGRLGGPGAAPALLGRRATSWRARRPARLGAGSAASRRGSARRARSAVGGRRLRPRGVCLGCVVGLFSSSSFSHCSACRSGVDLAFARDGQRAGDLALGVARGRRCCRARRSRAGSAARTARAERCAMCSSSSASVRSRSSEARIVSRPPASRTWSARAACGRPGASPRARGPRARRPARTSRARA